MTTDWTASYLCDEYGGEWARWGWPDAVAAASYLCGGCGHTDRGAVAELVARMTAHWRSHRD